MQWTPFVAFRAPKGSAPIGALNCFYLIALTRFGWGSTRQAMALAGQVVLVSGGGSGIGRAVAKELSSHGARVIVIDLPRHSPLATVRGGAEATAREINAAGGWAKAWPADVSDRKSLESLVSRVTRELGRVDIAVLCAYQSTRKPVLELTMSDVETTLQTTLLGAFSLAQLAARAMARRASDGLCRKIVFISSVLAEHPYLHDTSAPYNMAKGGVEALSRTMASGLARYGINVNTVKPGWINTEGERRFVAGDKFASRAKFLPRGIGDPKDVAKAVSYLCLPSGNYVTGSSLTVDGGFGISQRVPGLHPPVTSPPVTRPSRSKL